MANDARRKEKKRLKREQKRAQIHKAASASPYKRLAQSGEIEACYVNANWQDSGLATIYMVRRKPVVGYAIAVFAIDIWCAGLKDVSGNLEFMQEDVKHSLDKARGQFELQRIEAGMARGLIAGGIRFARQNGFRLPAHYERWTQLAGVDDVASADLTSFGKDGGLLWVGPLDELKQRLIGSTPEVFLAREDVDYIADVNEEDDLLAVEDALMEDLDPDSEAYAKRGEALELLIQNLVLNLANDIAETLAEQGKQIPENLSDAILALHCAEIIIATMKLKPEEVGSAQAAMASAAGRLLQPLFQGTPEQPTCPPALEKTMKEMSGLYMDAMDKTLGRANEFFDKMRESRTKDGAFRH